ncbi:MAG TPA: arginine--tRNA ligase [Candidatus Nanoarchaeia archaeon]|nr:arginine--tRNA ligase [Candidatus Nanoarchaeia archaeon]
MDFQEEISKLITKETKQPATLEVPPDDKLGDYAYPCFDLAQQQKKSPVLLAQELSKKIKADFLEKIDTKGPYINFFIKPILLATTTIKTILKEKEDYGKQNLGKETVMIEYSQANTHKAFHIGHVRGTSMGESLARILEYAGKKVLRANYQGDTGMHVAKWLWCYLTYHNNEPLKKDEQWIANIYVEAVQKLENNPEAEEKAAAINKKLDEGTDKKLIDLWKNTRKLSLDAFETIYRELNTRFDYYFFESQVEQPGKYISQQLLEKGIAEQSEDAIIMNLEKYNLGVWVLLRKDGTALYSAKDLALAQQKFQAYDVDQSIHIVGKAQELHFYQLFKTLELMGFPQAKKCHYIPVNEIRFPWGKMSSRTGDNILYSNFKKELLELAKKAITERNPHLPEQELEKRALTIAIACLKYAMLKQDQNKGIIFNKEEAMKFEGETGPYLLYSYARAHSIINKSTKKKYQEPAIIHDKEKQLIKHLAQLPEAIQQAANETEPAIIAHYAYQLAQHFNEFYHHCPVIGSEEEAYRLQLVQAYIITLENALYLLGIDTLQEM